MRKHEVTEYEYVAVHLWLKQNYGKAAKCTNTSCLGVSTRFEWALKRECKYEMKRSNFTQLCKQCHVRYDLTEESKKKMSEHSRNTNKTECLKGHSLEGAYLINDKKRGKIRRQCLVCVREHKAKYRASHKEKIRIDNKKRYLKPII